MITKLRYHLLSRLGPDSQHAIAADCDIPEPQLSEYCSGRRPIPPAHLARLAARLSVPPGELVGNTTLDEVPLP